MVCSLYKVFPHLEKLQTKFNTDLQIITITDDSEERINQFLRKQSLSLPVVIDEKRKLSLAFPHRSLPHTIVIDKTGIVKAITTSSEISEELIKNIIAGKEIQIKEKKDVMTFDPSKPLSKNENINYQVTITPFQDGYPSLVNPTGEDPYKNRRILAMNLAPKSLFEIAHQFPVSTRTITEVRDPKKLAWSPQNAICFDLIVPQQLGHQRFDIMKQHLSAYLPYVSTIEERIIPIKVLKQIATNGEFSLYQSKEGTARKSSQSGKGLSMKNSPIVILAKFLETRLNRPVIDETNLNSNYDLEIPWYNENPDQINEELKKVGLEIIDEKRKIKLLVIKDK